MTGAEIRRWREARGLSQAALASALAVSANTVARWERDERTPPPYLRRTLDGPPLAKVHRLKR